MKIKIRIPKEETVWPVKFLGETVEVEIISVTFPDGLNWSCEGYQAELVTDHNGVEYSLSEGSASFNLIDWIGEKPASIEIKF